MSEKQEEFRIAIIGGGFSGTMALANIINLSDSNTPSYSIDIFESAKNIANGIAYSTDNAEHLLNVRAERMGAFADNIKDFYIWLKSPEGESAKQKFGIAHEIKSDSYVPRVLYGKYLEDIYKRSAALAESKGIKLRYISAKVTDAIPDHDHRTLKLVTNNKNNTENLEFDAVILATGNLPPKRFAFQNGLVRAADSYVPNVWDNNTEIYKNLIKKFSANNEIVIIGTGLTMIDNIISLKQCGYKGVITAISRNGLIPSPHSHTEPYPEWEWLKNPESRPKTAAQLLSGIRKEIKNAKKHGHDWRAVIDSIRPITQEIWKSLSIPERRKFLKKLSSFWNIHRHRMAPSIHSTINSMKNNGALKIIAGKIYYVGSDEEGLTVAYRKRGANRVETIRADLVLNCTGPEYDIADSQHTLLRNLRDRDLITIGPLRIGIEINKDSSAKGNLPDSIFPVGTLLVGELFECTAVPELREQAKNIAERIIDRIINKPKEKLAVFNI